MNQTNFCNAINVETVSFEQPFAEMYRLQRILQLKYMNFDHQVIDAKVAAQNCVYWLHCLSTEFLVELMGWFEENETTTALTDDQRLKEIQMEGIDGLHFVMNFGLELQIEPEVIQTIGDKTYIDVKIPNRVRCKQLCDEAVTAGIKAIDCLPWKKWKSYDDLTVADVRTLALEDYATFYQRVLRVCGAVGLDKDSIVSMYCAKNRENISRQENGY